MSRQQQSAPGRIDIHAHLTIDASAESGDDAIRAASWDTAAAVERLDLLGIRRQILSMPVHPGEGPDARHRALDTARSWNERFVRIVDQRPHRFGAFASIPITTADEAIGELTRAIEVLQLDGVALTSSSDRRLLGDPFYEPVFAVAEERGIPVFVHPNAAVKRAQGSTVPAFLLEYPFDTARSIVDAIYAGVFVRHPELKMIVAHCGGALPSLAWRIIHLAAFATLAAGDTAESVTDADVRRSLAQLYYDTALSGSNDVLTAVLKLADENHLLFGTDSGAASDDIIEANTTGLATSSLTPSQVRLAEHGNAVRLLR